MLEKLNKPLVLVCALGFLTMGDRANAFCHCLCSDDNGNESARGRVEGETYPELDKECKALCNAYPALKFKRTYCDEDKTRLK